MNNYIYYKVINTNNNEVAAECLTMLEVYEWLEKDALVYTNYEVKTIIGKN